MADSLPLSFISDDKLIQCVKQLIETAKTKRKNAAKEIHKNVIDPFSALLDAMPQGMPLRIWLKLEEQRQIQKSFENALGDFHENVLGSMPGWEKIGEEGSAFDIINKKKLIVAEIKNKFNTMNSGKTEQVYRSMHDHVKRSGVYHNYTAFLVFIVPRNTDRYDNKWEISSSTHPPAAEETVRVTDGASFYAKAACEREALYKLYRRLPLIIEKITKVKCKQYTDDPIYEGLFKQAYRAHK